MYNSKKTTLFFISAFLLILTFSCKKSDSVFNNLVTVSASVSGFVTDENDLPLKHAFVYFGDKETKTDEFGFFEVNARVSKNAVVRILHPDSLSYFSGVKSFEATEGKNAFFRVQLIKKVLIGTVSSSMGGELPLNGLNPAKIFIRANGVKIASSGASYSGDVNVYAAYIDPSARDIVAKLPGDLRGTATDGTAQILSSVGMMQIELRGSGNQLLQLSQAAKLTMPIPTANASLTDATVPLWYLDETTGLWKEEGIANKVGNTYEGEVNHFSAWNCDFPHHGTHINCHVHDNDGHPLPHVEVVITDDNHAGAGCGHGFTDDDGNIDGYAPEGTNLHLSVFSGSNCTTPIHEQQFNPSITDISCPISSVATLTGTIIDCNNNPVTNGRIILRKDGHLECYNVSSQIGRFNVQTLLCNVNNNSAEIFAQDLNGHAQSISRPIQAINIGVNSIDTLIACGTAMTLCNQIWMVKNLDVDTFRNGVAIPQIMDAASWASVNGPAWCWSEFNPANRNYGKLYNWAAVNAADSLAPSGWHIPTNAEWVEYADCLGGYLNAGTKMKESGFSHWVSTGVAGDNSSGFTGLPAGGIDENGVKFSLTYAGYFWTISSVSATDATCRILFAPGTDLGKFDHNKKRAYSVRLLKN